MYSQRRATPHKFKEANSNGLTEGGDPQCTTCAKSGTQFLRSRRLIQIRLAPNLCSISVWLALHFGFQDKS